MATLAEILALPDSQREILSEFDIINRTTLIVETIRFSAGGYITGSDEFQVANIPYPARLKRAHEFSVSMMEPRITGRGPAAFAPVEIINNDDAYSYLLTDYIWNGGIVRTKVGDRRGVLADFITVGTTTIASEPHTSTNGNIIVPSTDWQSRGISSQPNKFLGYGGCLRVGFDTLADANLASTAHYNFVDFTYAHSIEFRVRTYGTANAGSDRLVVGKPLQWNFSFNGSAQLVFRIYNSTDYYLWRWATSDIDVTSIDWKHISLKLPAGFDMTADDPILWSDGVELAIQSEATSAGVGDPWSAPIQVGGIMTGYLEAEIDVDELRIWGRGIDETGVNNRLQGPVWPNAPHLPGYFRFDEMHGAESFPQNHAQSTMIAAVTEGVGQTWRDHREELPAYFNRRDLTGHRYDGTDDRINVTLGATSKFDVATAGEFTIDITFCLEGLPSVRAEIAMLFEKQDSYRLYINTSDELVIGVWTGSWQDTAMTAFNPVIGQMYTVLASYDEVNAKLWIPSISIVEPVQTIAKTDTIQDSTNQMVIGASSGSTNRFIGWIGTTRSWDTATVNLDDRLGNWAHYIDPTSLQYGNLVCEYRMNEVSGSTITDHATGVAAALDGTFNGVSGTVNHEHAYFDVDSDVDWRGTGTGLSHLRGKDIPQSYGYCQNIEPVFMSGHDSMQIWKAHDNSVDGWRKVRESGVEGSEVADSTDLWGTAAVTTGQFKTDLSTGLLLTYIPSGQLTCDFTGHDASPDSYIATAFEVFRSLARKGGLDVDALTWTQDERPNQVHWFSRFNAPTLDSTLDLLCRSISAHWVQNRIGQPIVDLIRMPSEWVPDYVIQEDDIKSIERLPAHTVSWQEKVQYGRIGITQEDTDLDSTIDEQEKWNYGREWSTTNSINWETQQNHPGSNKFTTDTALTFEWHGREEADRRIELYSEVRERFKVVLSWTPNVKTLWFTALAGEIATVIHSDHGLSGSGKTFIIAKMHESYESKEIELEVWGGYSAEFNLEPNTLKGVVATSGGLVL